MLLIHPELSAVLICYPLIIHYCPLLSTLNTCASYARSGIYTRTRSPLSRTDECGVVLHVKIRFFDNQNKSSKTNGRGLAAQCVLLRARSWNSAQSRPLGPGDGAGEAALYSGCNTAHHQEPEHDEPTKGHNPKCGPAGIRLVIRTENTTTVCTPTHRDNAALVKLRQSPISNHIGWKLLNHIDCL